MTSWLVRRVLARSSTDPHHQVRIFAGPDADHRELLGVLTMSGGEWLQFRAAMHGVLEAEIDPDVPNPDVWA